MMKRLLLTTAVALVLAAPQSHAADQLKLGFIGPLSGPLGLTGTEMQRGLDVALAELGNKIGGVPVKLTVVDDKAIPAEGVQAASKLIDDAKIDIVTGMTASNIFLATAPAFIEAKVTVIGGLAGPAEYAGKSCNPYVFVTSFQNDDWDMVMGTYMNKHNYKNVYFIGQDFQAGWEHIAGAQRTYKGKDVKPVFTPIAQVDYAAELAQIRAAKPDAVYAFMVGNGGIAFIKQYAQAGLSDIPLLGTDAMSTPLQWPALGDATVGVTVGTNWSYNFDNPANKRFVEAYKAKNNGRPPSMIGALQYDAVMLLDGAVKSIGGKIEDKEALHAALRKAPFQSIRGNFKFNNNQYPINDLYVERVEKDANGQLGLVVKEKAATDWQDNYHRDCAMK